MQNSWGVWPNFELCEIKKHFFRFNVRFGKYALISLQILLKFTLISWSLYLSSCFVSVPNLWTLLFFLNRMNAHKLDFYHFSFFFSFFSSSAGSVVHINSVPTQRWNMCISATIVPRKFGALLLCNTTCQSVCVVHSLCRDNSDIEIIRRIKTTMHRMGVFFSVCIAKNLSLKNSIKKVLNVKNLWEKFVQKL